MSVDVEALYRRYGPMVLRRCRALLGGEEEAVDAMQDTFVQVLRHAERLTEQAPSSLLYRIATRVCLNQIRSRRRRPETSSQELLQTLAAASAPMDEQAHGHGILARLFAGQSESTGTIAVPHLVDGMTHQEVASAVGMSVSGVRKRLRRLREALVAMDSDPSAQLARAIEVTP